MTDDYWNRFQIDFVPERDNFRGLAAYSDMDSFMEDNLEADPGLPFSYLDLEDEALYLAEDEVDSVVIQSLGKLAGFSGRFAGYEWGTMAMNAREFSKTSEVAEYLSGEGGLEARVVPQSSIADMIGKERNEASQQTDKSYRRRVDLDHIHNFSEDDLRFS